MAQDVYRIGETLTKMVNKKDKSVRKFFDDGGSAVSFEKPGEACHILLGYWSWN